jgi:hypothetical protein
MAFAALNPKKSNILTTLKFNQIYIKELVFMVPNKGVHNLF